MVSYYVSPETDNNRHVGIATPGHYARWFLGKFTLEMPLQALSLVVVNLVT